MAEETYLREDAGWRSLRDHHLLLTDDPGLPITHGSQINEFNTGWARFGLPLTKVTHMGQTGPNWHTDLGTFYITGDGVTVEGLDIPYPVNVFGNDVTLRRCRVRSASFYQIKPADIPTYYTGFTLEDCELDGGGVLDPQIAVLGTVGATFRRCHFHGFSSSGPRLSTDNLMSECFLHDFVHGPDGHEAGTSANGPDTNITIERSKIQINTEGNGGAIAIYQDFGGHDGIYLRDNWVDGGSYAIYCGIHVPGSPFPPSTHVEITGNIFARTYNPLCGGFGPQAQWRDDPTCVWENNTWGPGAAADHRYATGELLDPNEIIRDL